MLSICIPVFNFDISALISDLNQQIKKIEVPVEVIIIDDASDKNYLYTNKIVCENHKYIELNKNIGRSKIRNLFLNYAKYEYLLFLDCDGKIITNDFVSKYINSIKKRPKVIYGGRKYPDNPPSDSQFLRWNFGVNRESFKLIDREKFPYKTFMTNNFVIEKQLLSEVPFNENIIGYGHEDTLLSIELKEKGIEIQHIDNPILNIDIESNEVFLKKTHEGIKNLTRLINHHPKKVQIISFVQLANKYQKIKNIGLISLFLFLFKLSKPILLKKLLIGKPSVFVFSLYKLGYFSNEMEN